MPSYGGGGHEVGSPGRHELLRRVDVSANPLALEEVVPMETPTPSRKLMVKCIAGYTLLSLAIAAVLGLIIRAFTPTYDVLFFMLLMATWGPIMGFFQYRMKVYPETFGRVPSED